MDTFLGFSGMFKKPFYVRFENRAAHTLIVGMTGAGKTTTLKNFVAQDSSKFSTIVIDGKGDPEILGAQKSKFLISSFGASFEGTHGFNPLVGSIDQVVGSFVDACEFSNEYYRGCSQRLIMSYLKLQQAQGKLPRIDELYDLTLSIDGVLDLLPLLPSSYDSVRKNFLALEKIRADTYMQQHAGLTNRLSYLIESSWFDSLTGAFTQIPLEEAFERKMNIYVGLQKLSNREGAGLLGKILLSRIGSLAANRARLDQSQLSQKPYVSVIVDELASIAYPGFEVLPQTVRSSKVMLTLATQTLSDLKRISEEFSQQIQTNTAVKIIHQQNSGVDADTWAKHIGTKEIVGKPFDRFLMAIRPPKNRYQFKDKRSFIVDPDILKNLSRGRALVEQMTPKNGKEHRMVDIYA
jgi:hypothetical protein